MNIKLFLDIDGVLNNDESLVKFGRIADFHSAINDGREFDRNRINFDIDCLNRVRHIQQEYSLDVVITSMWRFGATSEHFVKLFKLYEWNLDGVEMINPNIYEDGKPYKRSDLVEDYITSNGVTKFIIFDDTASHFDKFLNRFVLTDGKLGFTEMDVLRSKVILDRYNGI